MDQLDREIAAFEDMRARLEARHRGEWAVFHQCKLIGTFPTLDDAADDALDKFGDDVFLIRQIGRKAVSNVPSVVRIR